MPVETSLHSFDNLKSDVCKLAFVYDWNSAIQVIETFFKTNNAVTDIRIFELLGDCYYNLAFQRNTRDEFKKVILRSKEAYDKVTNDNRCKARSSFCKYCLSDDPDGRRKIIISECLPIARQLVAQLDSSEKDERSIASANVELIEYLTIACSISSDRKQLVELVKEAKATGRNAFLRFEGSSSSEIIPVANSYSRFLEWASGTFIGSEEIKQITDEVVPFIDNLVKLAGQVEDAKLKSLAYEASAIITQEFKGDPEEAVRLIEKATKESVKTGDNYLIGREFTLLGYTLHWAHTGNDVLEERRKLQQRAVECCSSAMEKLKVPLATLELVIANWCFIIPSLHLSMESAIASEKLRYVDRAIEVGREGLQYSKYCPLAGAESFLSRALTYAAEITPKKDERVKLLSEAIDLIRSGLLRVESLTEPVSWDLGIWFRDAALPKARLADEKTESKELAERANLLKDSVADWKKSVEILIKAASSMGIITSGLLRNIGLTCEDLGNTLVKLYDLSKRRADCQDAIKAFDDAANYYSQANLMGYIPSLAWKSAKLYDSMSEYSKSSSAFARAAQKYQEAAANQKSLQKSFLELSLYMQAWSKIEEARLLHSDEKYQSASEKLNEASGMLDKTESFRYLVKHYQAFSKMERAEELSRKESNQEASSSFGEAYGLFEEVEDEIQSIEKERTSEENELKEYASLSESRGKYCLAMKELAEAKSLDKSGEVKQSMSKYRSASDTLRELEQGASEQDRAELYVLGLSCEAFATMKEAELKSSPELYSKASEIFLKAKENNIKQSFVLSCLANSSICDAFEAGTRFKKSRDASLYSQIKDKLGAASQYYEEAGFEIACDWTRATEALFDALAYLAAAEREIDPQKKTQMYHLAEKHLELSARRYGDIGYEKKRAEVLKHLKTARENRELLITPIEALSQSPTVSVTPVNFTRDQAAGLERFEVANLTGNVSVSAKSTNIGSSFRIDIDIANVGKSPALLMKLDSLAPSNGFDIDTKNSNIGSQFLPVDGNSISLDLKGKRLEYLKSHEVTLHLIAKNGGNYQIRPRILFVDEFGKHRTYEFEPQNIQVTSVERKLAAIMFTDMAGYTALGQRNESLSLALVSEQRNLLRPIFKRHNGREIKTMGDSFLVEFASALDAVTCAYDIQRATREFNITLPQDRRITLRVGVHLGDVIESEDGDISGDAVNVASRIEPLAEHGGVCLTRQVYDNIQNKFDLKLESLGPKPLKNVSSPIEVFKMVMPWE